MLEKLEDALSCLICKELLEIPEQATCDHIFCALCIRRYLTNDQHCPVCRKEMHAGALRRIRVLETVIEEYKLVKGALEAKLEQVSASVPLSASASASVPASPALSQCPVCLKEMPISEIQGSHIVNCLKPKPEFKRRAVPNYSILKDKDLKSLLQKDGLAADGSRSRLTARHTEWILQWNVNAARDTPLSPLELRLKLEKWESALYQKQKKVEVEGWAAENDEMYRDLEADAFSKLGREGPRKRRLSEIMGEPAS